MRAVQQADEMIVYITCENGKPEFSTVRRGEYLQASLGTIGSKGVKFTGETQSDRVKAPRSSSSSPSTSQRRRLARRQSSDSSNENKPNDNPTEGVAGQNETETTPASGDESNNSTTTGSCFNDPIYLTLGYAASNPSAVQPVLASDSANSEGTLYVAGGELKAVNTNPPWDTWVFCNNGELGHGQLGWVGAAKGPDGVVRISIDDPVCSAVRLYADDFDSPGYGIEGGQGGSGGSMGGSAPAGGACDCAKQCPM